MINPEQQTKRSLPPKAFNRLTSTLTASSLEVFDSEKNKPRQFIGPVAVTMNDLSADHQDVLSSLTKPSDAYITSIDQKGLSLLPQMVQQPDKQIIFRTVFGGTERMPLRALSYLIPSIKIAEKLVNAKSQRNSLLQIARNVAIEFLFMNEASSGVNGLDRGRCRRASDLFSDVAKKYVQMFHPAIARSVSFPTDDGFSDNLLSHPAYERVVERAERSMSEQAYQDVLDMAGKKSTRSDAFRYATLHSFVHDGFVEGVLDKNHRPSRSILTSFGASPEKRFFAVRRATVPHIGSEFSFSRVPTVQFITKHTVPPYVLMTPHDIALEDALKKPSEVLRVYAGKEDNGVHTVVKNELMLLAQDAGNIGQLEDFLGGVSKI